MKKGVNLELRGRHAIYIICIISLLLLLLLLLLSVFFLNGVGSAYLLKDVAIAKRKKTNTQLIFLVGSSL